MISPVLTNRMGWFAFLVALTAHAAAQEAALPLGAITLYQAGESSLRKILLSPLKGSKSMPAAPAIQLARTAYLPKVDALAQFNPRNETTFSAFCYTQLDPVPAPSRLRRCRHENGGSPQPRPEDICTNDMHGLIVWAGAQYGRSTLRIASPGSSLTRAFCTTQLTSSSGKVDMQDLAL